MLLIFFFNFFLFHKEKLPKASLGIKVDKMDLYKGKEDHTTEEVPCGHCHTLVAIDDCYDI